MLIEPLINYPYALKEIQHVPFVRTLTAKSVNGQFLIDFVTESGLETYVKSVIFPFVGQVGHIAINAGEVLTKGR